MLDLKFVRDNLSVVEQALKNRNASVDLSEFIGLDKKRRELLVEVEGLKSRRNTVSQEVSRLKKEKQDAEALIVEMRGVGDRIGALDAEVKDIEGKLSSILMYIPNVPHASVPVGADEEANPEIRRWGEPRKFDKEPLPHWEIGEKLGILDFERGGKVSGARFTFYKGLGSRLERSLISFMIDLHTQEHGYTEFFRRSLSTRTACTAPGSCRSSPRTCSNWKAMIII
jgi:seryl-tRNA synthetase